MDGISCLAMPLIEREGVRLHFSERGSGPCVLWHTGGGGDGTMWERAGYPDALPGRRHLLFDHRGHGQSGQPTDPAAHRLDQYVADVLAVLDAAEVEMATLVGYSDGGIVVLSLAAAHPERVEAVVAIGGVAHPDDTNEHRHRLAEEVRGRGFRDWLEEMSASESQPAPHWLMENLASTPTEMFVLEVEGWADEPTECSYFGQIAAPVLIVCGEKEDGDGAAELAVAALGDGTAVVLPGLGHLEAFWRSDLTAPAIAEFLAQRVPV